MASGVIYALSDSRTPYDYRYVGKTERTPESRLTGHLRAAKRPTRYSERWVASVVAAGAVVLLTELERSDQLNTDECKWIAALREAGYRLTNTQPGGAGGAMPVGYYKHTPEALAKIRKARGWTEEPAARKPSSGRSVVQANRERVWSEEARQRCAENARRQHESASAADKELRRKTLLATRAATPMRQCDVCGMIASPGPMGNHLRASKHESFSTVQASK